MSGPAFAAGTTDPAAQSAGAVELKLQPATVRARAHEGMVTYMADAAIFEDCRTGRHYPIAMEGEFPALQKSYRENASKPGAALRMTLEGVTVQRDKMEGGGKELSFFVLAVAGATPGADCKELAQPQTLIGTEWSIQKIGTMEIKPGAHQQKLPFVKLTANNDWYEATVGCNGMGGKYRWSPQTLEFEQGVSTLMACRPPIHQWEQAMRQVLRRTKSWHINGFVLTLLDHNAEPLAVLRASNR
mgnify:FL=1